MIIIVSNGRKPWLTGEDAAVCARQQPAMEDDDYDDYDDYAHIGSESFSLASKDKR
jgi:hypothetical protein